MVIPLDVFISHADEDKKIAKEIAEELRKYDGVNAFVAHDDLDPGTDWKNDLTQHIFDCDSFMIVLTNKFHQAEWTEQEVGIAHAFKKTMIPIRFDKTPTLGFMDDFQATKISYPLVEGEIKNLVDVIVAYSEEGQRQIKRLISRLSSAGSFAQANAFANILFDTTSKFTKEQINMIAKAYLENGQISGAWTSGPKCLMLFQNNYKKIEPELREKIKPYLQSS